MFKKRINRTISQSMRVILAASLIAGVVLAALPPNPAQAQSADDGFNPGANGNIYALVVQPDGKILWAMVQHSPIWVIGLQFILPGG
ncbi:MAG: hypothetical protein IBX69_12155 [Anaerolineales bacterium]|nr:hypothetical protein [Anaerolineales bacterium]